MKQLEAENAKIQEEFGHQRAKMKELYVQKESKYMLLKTQNIEIFTNCGVLF